MEVLRARAAPDGLCGPRGSVSSSPTTANCSPRTPRSHSGRLGTSLGGQRRGESRATHSYAECRSSSITRGAFRGVDRRHSRFGLPREPPRSVMAVHGSGLLVASCSGVKSHWDLDVRRGHSQTFVVIHYRPRSFIIGQGRSAEGHRPACHACTGVTDDPVAPPRCFGCRRRIRRPLLYPHWGPPDPHDPQ